MSTHALSHELNHRHPLPCLRCAAFKNETILVELEQLHQTSVLLNYRWKKKHTKKTQKQREALQITSRVVSREVAVVWASSLIDGRDKACVCPSFSAQRLFLLFPWCPRIKKPGFLSLRLFLFSSFILYMQHFGGATLFLQIMHELEQF